MPQRPCGRQFTVGLSAKSEFAVPAAILRRGPFADGLSHFHVAEATAQT
jgi:hypothetical protein